MNLYYFKKSVTYMRNIPYRNLGAGGKAKLDMYEALEEIGVKPILHHMYFKEEPAEQINQKVETLTNPLQNGDVVFEEFPSGAWTLEYKKSLADHIHKRQAFYVGIVHDIHYFRGTYEDNLEVERTGSNEYENTHPQFQYWLMNKGFNTYDALMVPTENEKIMIERDFDYQGKIIVFGPYPYKSRVIPDRRKKTNQVIFAGSINKAQYLLDYLQNHRQSEVEWNVCANITDKNKAMMAFLDNPLVHYKGSKEQENILMDLEGSYGLVWDSYRNDTKSGGMAFYEQINFPHKLSLYLAAEIPVIVWSKAASANYVMENNVGWVIDDLSHLDELILSITDGEYQSKLDSLERIGGLIRDGLDMKVAALQTARTLNEKSSYLKPSTDGMPAPELGLDSWVIEMNRLGKREEVKTYFTNEISKDKYRKHDSVSVGNEYFQEAKQILTELGVI